MPNWEPAADRGLWALSDPRLSSPARMRKKCCYGQKNFGSICSSLSLSLTYLSHTTNINPFENKVWEVYFYKEVCSFVHVKSSICLIIFPLIFVLWVYNTLNFPGNWKKKTWNMKMTVIPTVINALGTVTKGLLRGLEIRGRVEDIQTKVSLRSARILRRVQKTWRDLLSL